MYVYLENFRTHDRMDVGVHVRSAPAVLVLLCLFAVRFHPRVIFSGGYRVFLFSSSSSFSSSLDDVF